MRKPIGAIILTCAFITTVPASSQVKMTKEQMLFYTSDWRGERFPDGRPKIPDDLLKRALDVSIEDVWEYLGKLGYKSQFDGGFQALHPEKPFAGRALTAQYMPLRPDMIKAITAEGKAEGARRCRHRGQTKLALKVEGANGERDRAIGCAIQQFLRCRLAC